jgi:hypothetical protein
VDGRGGVFAAGVRGPTWIVVRVPTASSPADTVRVIVIPLPVQIVQRSGGGQSAPAGTPLANPIVVRVNAADGGAVPDVTVRFSAPGSVSPASAVTAADGTAQTRWTLGTGAGTQSLTATVTGLAPLTIQATAR